MISAPCAIAEELSIIINSSNPVQKVTPNELKTIYLKQKKFWPDNEPIVPFELEAEQSARSTFIQKIIQLSDSEHEDYWINKKHTDGDYPPQSISSEKMIIRMVSKFKGGIGYVRSSFLSQPGTATTGIKIIGVVK